MQTTSLKSYTAAVFALIIAFYSSFVALTPLAHASSATNGLVSCWSFDGNGVDAIGSNNLTNINNMSYVNGQVGFAADVDTHNSLTDAQYLSIDNGVQQGLQMTSAISGSVWVNYDESMDGKYSMIFSKLDDTDYTTNNVSYGLALNGGGHVLQFFASRDGDTVSDSHSSTAPVAGWEFIPVPGTWYHIVVTYNAGDAHLYINGKEQKSLYNYTDASIYQSSAPFAVGYTSVIREMHGKIDELGMWNRALSAKEVKKLYNKGKGVSCASLAKKDVDANEKDDESDN